MVGGVMGDGRVRAWVVGGLLAFAGVAWGCNLGEPSPAWPAQPGDRPQEAVHELAGPGRWPVTLGGTVDGASCRSDKLDSFYRQSWQPNVEAVITNTGVTPVVNPRLVVNGKRDWRTLPGMVAEATAGCNTPAERARGIWEFVRRNVCHSLAGADRHAWQILGSYGYAMCDGQTQVLAELWSAAGLPTRYSLHNASHTTPEVFYDGAWHHLDADEDALILGLDNRTPASAAAVAADHYLATRSVFYGMYAASIPYQEVSRQLNASLFVSAAPAAYPIAPEDAASWVLLPGASLAWRWSNQGKHYSALQAGATGAGPPPSALYANGQMVYQPDLGRPAGRLGLIDTANVRGPQAAAPGLQPVDPAQPASAVWRFALPWAMVGGRIEATVTTAGDHDPVALSVSRDGASFTRVAVTSAAGEQQLDANLDSWLSPYTQWQGADRLIWLRLDSAPREGLAWSLTRIRFTLDLQMNPLSLPELTLGPNEVEYRDDTSGPRQVRVAQRWVERTAWTQPSAPQPTGPVGAAPAAGLTFAWTTPSSADGLAYYQLVVSDRPDLRWSLSPFFERLLTTSSWRVPQDGMLSPGATYYWHVRASSQNGVWGPWSPTASFTVTQPAAPTGLQLQPTADGLGYTLRWSPGAGGSAPVHYRVYGSNEKSFTPSDGDHPVLTGGGQVATVADYQAKSVDLNRLDTWPGNLVATTGDTALVVAGPAAVAGANKYHWRVIAEDANGNRSTPTSFVSLPSPLLATQPAVTTIASTDAFSYQPKLVTSDGQLSMLGNAMVAYWDGMRTSWKLIEAPAGLSIDASTGAISGTPLVGLHPVHVQASVARNELLPAALPALPVQTTTIDQQFDLRVSGPPSTLSLGALPAALTAGQPFAVTVNVADEAGYGLSVPVTLSLDDPAAKATLAGATTVTAVNGAASFTGLSITRAGAGYRLKATAGAAVAWSAAPELPAGLAVTPGAVDPAHCTVSVDRATAAGDGSQPVTVTLTLSDQAQNPVPGVAPGEVRFSVDLPDGVSLAGPTAPSDGQGAMTATLTSTRPHPVRVSATVRGERLAATVSVRFRSHFVMDLPAGRQLVGLPFTPDDPSPEAVLGASEAYVRRWRTETDTAAVHHPGDADAEGFFAFGPGRGLWLSPSRPLHLDLLGEPTPDGPFTLSVPRGWSNLANPFPRDLTWSTDRIAVLVNGQERGRLSDASLWEATVRPYLWLYSPALDGLVPVVPPYTQATVGRGSGFWAYALTDGVQLRLDPPAHGRAADAPSSLRDWHLQVSAQQQAGRQAVALLGVSGSLARALAVEAPPGVAGASVQMQLVQADGSRAAGELRPGNETTWSWDLVVTAPADGEVTLAWPSLLRSLPRGLVANLQDLTSGATCLMNSHGFYTYPATRGERRLRLTARVGHDDRADITSVSAQPNRGGGLSVSLSLTGPAEVALNVRGLGGRPVRQLTASADGAAPVTVSWDGTDETGRRVPAGTYVLEATAAASNGAISRAVRTVTVR